jgi:hypothetical protein
MWEYGLIPHLRTIENGISIITYLKSVKSCGYDEMSTKLLKISTDYVSALVSHLCNNLRKECSQNNLIVRPTYKKKTLHLQLQPSFIADIIFQKFLGI